MASNGKKKIGVWAFLIGVFIALLAGLLSGSVSAYMGTISIIMVVLGLIVGYLNITDDEVSGFIIAAIGLATGAIAISQLGPVLGGTIGPKVQTAFTVFSIFVAGAVFIPALKAVYKISKD